jgi:hypothetical protein
VLLLELGFPFFEQTAGSAVLFFAGVPADFDGFGFGVDGGADDDQLFTCGFLCLLIYLRHVT